MSYRENLITGDPIIFAPERAHRPNAFRDSIDRHRCPFCPGHEDDTPPEVARSGGDRWTVRVVPNKYPATPYHEVIVESPDHDAAFADVSHAPEIVRMYKDRYESMRSHQDVKHACLFKNHGEGAGASLPHLHSQLIGTPFQPPRIAREASAFARRSACPLCEAIPRHRRDHLVAEEDDHFVRFAPYGSSMPYQQWIVPKRHQPELSSLSDSEIEALATMLQRAGAATLRMSPSMNWMFMSFAGEPAAHFYVDLFPRMTTIAGFELGTGAWIGIVDPADAARKVV